MKASELINRCGWLQGNYGNPEEGFCLAGAIAWSFKDRTWEEQTRARSQLCLALNGGYITTWNDTLDRTKEEVIALLESIGE